MHHSDKPSFGLFWHASFWLFRFLGRFIFTILTFHFVGCIEMISYGMFWQISFIPSCGMSWHASLWQKAFIWQFQHITAYIVNNNRFFLKLCVLFDIIFACMTTYFSFILQNISCKLCWNKLCIIQTYLWSWWHFQWYVNETKNQWKYFQIHHHDFSM